MTAVKLRIQDLVEGTFDGKYAHTMFGEVSEARILGTLVDVFISDDNNYISLTVDDGTETVRIKAWGQDVEDLKQFLKGDLIDVVGKVREYNDEIYLTSEVISKVPPNKWVLRELELMKGFVESGAKRPVVGAEPEEVQYIEPEADVAAESEAGSEEVEAERGELKEVQGEEMGIEAEPKEEKKEISTEKKQVSEEVDFEEIEEFEIFGEDEVVETVLDLLGTEMTKETLIAQSGLDEIDVELALRELLDERKIKKEGEAYRRTNN
jgi:RPA family protein